VTSFWSIENSAGKRVTNKRIAGFRKCLDLVSNLIIAYALTDTSIDFATVQKTLDFKNAYFLLLEPKYWGGGLANIWGACAPPGPNVEPPLPPPIVPLAAANECCRLLVDLMHNNQQIVQQINSTSVYTVYIAVWYMYLVDSRQ